MIYLVVGENQFRIDEVIANAAQGVEEVVRLDGASLTRETLLSALFAVSLFATKRIVIIDQLSKQKSLWEALPSLWTEQPDGEVLFLEPHPDKRLKTYKWLSKEATIVDAQHFAASDVKAAERWLIEFAKQRGVNNLGETQANKMVQRAVRADSTSNRAIIDQQLLATATMQLVNADVVSDELIETVLAPSLYENVFSILTTALDGRQADIERQVAILSRTEQAYMVLGLLSSQLSQLAALMLADQDTTTEEIAKDIGAHPFALRSMKPYARKLTIKQLSHYIELFKKADEQIKTSTVDPWVALDIALAKIAQSVRK